MKVTVVTTPGTVINKDLAVDITLSNVDYEQMLFIEQALYFYQHGHKMVRDVERWGPAPELEPANKDCVKQISNAILQYDNALKPARHGP
jgi:hypothetical protein